MRLEGSCHCKAVTFSVESKHPYPFNLCYCSICRKTAGSGGYAINISADNNTLTLKGKRHIGVYNAVLWDEAENQAEAPVSTGERSFCRKCGSQLWVWSPEWPELLHPHASAIDTPLPKPPERTHLMLGSKASWVEPRTDPQDKTFDEYPEESIAAWHERLGLEK